MNVYFEIPDAIAPFLHSKNLQIPDSFSQSEHLLAKWIQGDDEYRNQRLKLISYVPEGPWVVRHMVTGRPAVIGTKLPVKYQVHNQTLTATLDIGSSSKTAQRIVSVCKRYMSALAVDLGWVLEAKEEEELPEQMLGAIRLHHPEPA